MAAVSRTSEGVLYTSQMPQTSLRETIRRLGRVHNMHADAAESRFPPDKAERALWGLSPMSERERRLAEHGDGPKGYCLRKSRRVRVGGCDAALSALSQGTTASAGIV